MIISVASGKGGTGKTTVSTNLAVSLVAETTYIDCDVEEPNGHLFLKPQMRSSKKFHSFIPQVVDDLCTSCGKCADICRFSAITVIGSSTLVFPKMCHGCGGCMVVCPENAILEGKKEIGTIESGTAGNIAFHHGILNIGEPMAPPLIKELRRNRGPVMIIDAPPGTSCPVIAAVKKSDYVILVTEPTPFGLYDLIIAHETMKKLNLPCGLVINRSDLGNNGVHDYARENGLPILLEIPFDRKIAELYSEGQLLVDAMPEWKEGFRRLFTSVTLQVEKGATVQ